MSSYFDDADAMLRACFEERDPGYKGPQSDGPDTLQPGEAVRWTEFWRRYHAWENQLIEDCLRACRARKFPSELANTIKLIISRRRVFATSKDTSMNEREASAVLSMRMSFLSSELHSTFHKVAEYGAKNKIQHLSDSPGWMAKRAPK